VISPASEGFGSFFPVAEADFVVADVQAGF
jgi:hypothetical protein